MTASSRGPLRALLMIYAFPPSGGSGVQRGVKLCRYLPESGVEPSVVTVEDDAYLRRGDMGVLDPSLAAELPAGLRVVRTKTGDLSGVRAKLKKLHLLDAAWHVAPKYFFERFAGWRGPLLAAARDEIRRARPDVMITSSPPNVVHLAALELRRSEGIPWVADFRDPWTLFWHKDWPSARAKRWEEDREAEVIRGADAVIANTPGQRREILERYSDVAPDKVAAIPNGYDAADFDVAPAPRPADEVLVVHTGKVTCENPKAESRERPRKSNAFADANPFDRSTHSLEWLLQAMSILRGRPGAPRVRARVVGNLDKSWEARAEALGVRAQVDFLGYVPHRESIAHLLAADLLYLPTIVRRDGRPCANVPQKTYEYLGAGRPVAALTDEGDVRDLMVGRARCTVLGPRDAQGLADLLARLAPGAAPHALPPDPPDARPWRRDDQVRRIAQVLRRVADTAGRKKDPVR